MQDVFQFGIAFLLFAIADFWSVNWATSIEKRKPAQTALAAAGIMFLTVSSMWIAFVGESWSAAVGMILGAGVGAYFGCCYFGSKVT